MHVRTFYLAPDDGASGGGGSPPAPVPPAPPTAAELAELEAQAKKLSKEITKGELAGMSESTAHALYEQLKLLNHNLAEAKAERRRGIFGF